MLDSERAELFNKLLSHKILFLPVATAFKFPIMMRTILVKND